MRKVVVIYASIVLSAIAYPLLASGQSVNQSELREAAGRDDVAAIQDLLARGQTSMPRMGADGQR
ncbi:hypothetical protein [Microbulbifer taiwanensis]|uniref:hypothetical protein n=1 Tax=Microbulbifer taiwanensis TaxID=986746 RepID=UPI00361E8BDB